MKKLFLLGALCLAVAFVLPAIAAQPEVPADGIEMHKTAKTVIFNHSTHTTVECGSCHHPVDGKEDYRSCSTPGCHDNFDRKDKSINGYYQMIHKTKDSKYPTCVACHTEQAGSDKEKKKELAGCAKSKCHP